MPQISIVANFYNSEKYIKKLVQSVQAQTFSDWELIAVNDCSPGRDSEILHRLAASDPRIRIIDNKENIGIARAKKVGIDASTGDYITFIDGDDWLEKDALKVMYDIATTQNAEVVFINTRRIYPFGYKINLIARIPAEDYNRTLSWKEFRYKYYVSLFGKLLFISSYWGKLYRGDILRNFKYEYSPKEESYEEDTTFLAHLLPHYNSFYFSDYQGYNWRWGGVSAGKKTDIFKLQLVVKTEIKRHALLSRLIQTYSVPDAQLYLDAELKNVIIGLIRQIVAENINDKPFAILKIKEILALPISDIVREMIKYDNKYLTDPYICAFHQNDADKLYELAEAHYKSLWKQRLIRKIILFFT